MLGSSADSLETLHEELRSASGKKKDGSAVGEGLFAASSVVRQQGALRRAVTDPSTDAQGRSKLAEAVFGPHLDETATALVAKACSLRWTSSYDLGEALEQLGVAAVVLHTEAAGDGDRLEDELFGFGRTVADNPGLGDALNDPGRTTEDKQALVRGLLDGNVLDSTVVLAVQSLAGGRHTVAAAVGDYVELAAQARGRLSALVQSAHPLTQEHRDSLADLLEKEYGKPVHLNTVVKPDLVGGIRVEVGNDVFDGTVANRIDQARRRLVG